MIAGMSGGCEGGESERSEPTPEECLTPENAQNEANQESTQSSLPLNVESSEAEPADRKRSQSAASGAAPDEEESVASSGDRGGHCELETEGNIVNCESDPGNLGSLSVSVATECEERKITPDP